MTTNVVELRAHLLAPWTTKGTGSGFCEEKLLTNPSGVTSVEARPPGVSFESTIIHEGPFCKRHEINADTDIRALYEPIGSDVWQPLGQ